MKKFNVILAILISLFFMLNLAGCGGASEKSSSAGNANETQTTEAKTSEQATDGKEQKAKKIAFSVWTMEWEFFQDMESGVREAAEAAGYSYVLHDQKGDEAEMVSGCQTLINSDIDALIVSPCKPEALGPIVEAAHDKDIPVVVCDIGGGGSNYDAIIISDNARGGRMNGEFLVNALKGKEGSKEIAVINTNPKNTYALRRSQAAKEVVSQAGFKLVKELTGDATTETAYRLMNDILVANPDVVAVICENDSAAFGAAQAAKDANKEGILFTGFDATTQGIAAIKEGLILCTIQQFPYDMGAKSVDLIDKLLKGEKLQFDNEQEREIFVDIKLIHKDNCDQISKTNK